jgi:hypothetical protein
MMPWSVGVGVAHLVLSQTAGVRLSYGLPRRCSSVQEERPVETRKGTGSTPAGGTTRISRAGRNAPFGYGLVSCPFKAGERVRVPHGVPVSGSSVG